MTESEDAKWVRFLRRLGFDRGESLPWVSSVRYGVDPDEDEPDDPVLEEMTEDDVTLGVYPRDATWGNNIEWDEWLTEDGPGRVHGWKEVPTQGPSGRHHWRRVRDGDTFAYELESGTIGVFELRNVENESDPRDMFFADAEAVGVLVEVDDDQV